MPYTYEDDIKYKPILSGEVVMSTKYGEIKDDLIKRKDAVLAIQKYGVGCLDADEFSPEECERFVIKNLSKLEGTEYNETEIDYKSAWDDLYHFITEGNSYIDDTSKAVLLVIEHQMRRLQYKHTKEQK